MTENKSAQEFFAEGMREFAATRYNASIDRLTHAITMDPGHALAVVSRGAAYLKLDMLDQARDDFDRAIQMDSGYARAYHMRGLVSEKRGDDQTALADFDRAIELNPEYGAAYYSRATLHTKMANTEMAQDDIEMVAHLGTRNLESFMNESNLWQTQHMRVEDAIGTELER
jgi:tetratricopeptide (TPR) repeat protein